MVCGLSAGGNRIRTVGPPRYFVPGRFREAAISMNELVSISSPLLPELTATAGEHASLRRPAKELV